MFDVKIRRDAKIFVPGNGGLVGTAVVRRLQPDPVYLVADTVGGICASASRPAEFIDDSVMYQWFECDDDEACDLSAGSSASVARS